MKMKNTMNKVSIYFLAGVATSENFLDEFKQEFVKRYEQAVTEVHAFLLYPYGNWNRRLWKQVVEISYDLLPRFRMNSSYLRAQSVADYIEKTHTGGEIIIIGHSSGGVAGVHAANLLNRKLFPEIRVIQIGSPKCTILQGNRESVLYIRAINRNGKTADPITHLGSWGGWERSKLKLHWNSHCKAPTHIYNIPIIGGHADYFRSGDHFVDEEGRSNLAKIMDCLWEWLV
jgi:pimeloyl-ACP methyl ester carboxylesterase